MTPLHKYLLLQINHNNPGLIPEWFEHSGSMSKYNYMKGMPIVFLTPIINILNTSYSKLCIAVCNNFYIKYTVTDDDSTRIVIYAKETLDQFINLALTQDERDAIIAVLRGDGGK